MHLPDDQRQLLGGFLRMRRESLAPGDVGLPVTRRRRTPGLRREEVAQICNISTTWYSWIEQGRDVSLSVAALARLAEGLRLSRAERAYLFEIARRRDPSPDAPGIDQPPEELCATMKAVNAPAYLLDRLWRVRDRNPAATHLFSPWFDSGEECLLRFVFLIPEARDFIRDWDDRARRIVAEFRADTARRPQDHDLQDLARILQAESADFAGLWNSYAVMAREGGSRRFRHPTDGELEFRQVTLTSPLHPDHKLVLLLPTHGASS